MVSLSDRSRRVLASVLASMCAFTCSLAVKNVPSGPSGVESSSKNTSKRIRGKKKNRAGSEIKRSGKVSGVSGKKKTKGSNKSSQKQSRTLNKDKTTRGAKSFLKLEDKKESEGLSTVGKAAAIGIPTFLGVAALGIGGTLVGWKLYYENLIKKSGILEKLSSAICVFSSSGFDIHFNFDGSRYDICMVFDGGCDYIVYVKGASSDVDFKSKLGSGVMREDLGVDGVNYYKDYLPVAIDIFPSINIDNSVGTRLLREKFISKLCENAAAFRYRFTNNNVNNSPFKTLKLDSIGDEGTLEGNPQFKVIRVG